MNDIAKHYDTLIDENNDPVYDPKPLRDYMNKWDGPQFIDKMNLDKSKSILEIGVGTGRLALKTAPLCLQFTGIDISPKTILKAKKNMQNFNNITLLCCDFLNTDLNETYDVIYSSLTFMHIKEKETAILKISNLLNYNGIFALSIDKNQEKYIDIGTSKIKVFPDNPAEIKKLIELTNLTIIEQYETDFAHIFITLKKSQ